jgi:hypothetical protein
MWLDNAPAPLSGASGAGGPVQESPPQGERSSGARAKVLTARARAGRCRRREGARRLLRACTWAVPRRVRGSAGERNRKKGRERRPRLPWRDGGRPADGGAGPGGGGRAPGDAVEAPGRVGSLRRWRPAVAPGGGDSTRTAPLASPAGAGRGRASQRGREGLAAFVDGQSFRGEESGSESGAEPKRSGGERARARGGSPCGSGGSHATALSGSGASVGKPGRAASGDSGAFQDEGLKRNLLLSGDSGRKEDKAICKAAINIDNIR